MNLEFRIMNKETGKIQSFTDLGAWKEGHALVLMIYRLTKKFPKEETFGLVIQMKRAAVSITSNIAEGFGRRSYKEKIRFYSFAQGSLTELQNQLLIARDVGYLTVELFAPVAAQAILANKIINGLIRKSKEYS